jgi:DNA-binding response OmpR family regulator
MKKEILLCDDEIHILRAAEFKFKRHGFEVRCASDGSQAWAMIQERCPDLLVTDCQMPVMNGFELCQRVRSVAELSQLPIVMLTAKGYEITSEEVVDQWGVLALMTKPFSPKELLTVVESCLAGQAGSTACRNLAAAASEIGA